jgi:hypothetical protein
VQLSTGYLLRNEAIVRFNPVGLVFIAFGIIALLARDSLRDGMARWSKFTMRVELPAWYYTLEAWSVVLIAMGAGLWLCFAGR